MGGQDVKWGEVYKKKNEVLIGGIHAKISKREVLEQEHKKKERTMYFSV